MPTSHAFLTRGQARLVIPLIAVTLIKMWLVWDQPITAYATASHDDRLFVDLAQHLVGGRWLGPYDALTLIKGPLYPLWVAMASMAGVPLPLSQQLLVTAACLVAVWALRPAVRSIAVLVAIYAVLLFNPAFFTVTRVVREGIYPALTLLACAAAIGLWLRRDRPARVLAGWAGMAGLALGLVWVTREEGVWLVPALGLLLGGTAMLVIRQAGRWRRLAALAGFPVLGIALSALVAGVNLQMYGVFTVTEFTTAEFVAAYGALTRVEPASRQPFVPVPLATRRQLYRVSPAFAELRRTLEGPSRPAWVRHSCQAVPAACGDIAGGWFMWAFREAVAAAGHHRSAPAAMAYYRRLADEVHAACERGALRCDPRRDTLTPPVRGEDIPAVLGAVARAAVFLVQFDDMPVAATPSRGDPASLQVFRDLGRARLSANHDGAPDVVDGRDQHALARLVAVRELFRLVSPVLALVAVVAVAAGSLLAVTGGRSALVLPIVALLVAAASRVVVIALIDALSFPAIYSGYLGPAHGLVLLAGMLGLIVIATTTRGWVRRRTGTLAASSMQAATGQAMNVTGSKSAKGHGRWSRP